MPRARCPSDSERIRRCRIAAARARARRRSGPRACRTRRSPPAGPRRAGASRSRERREAASDDRTAHGDLLDASLRAAPARSTAGTRRTRPAGRSSEMNEAGAITSIDVPNSRSWPKIHTVIGCTFCPNVSATIRSFHVHRNWKIPSDAIAGRPSGRISRRKMRISDAPSMRADSRMSFGSPTKKLRKQEDRERQPERGVEQDDPEHRVEEPEGVVQPEHRDQRHLQRHDEQRDVADEDPVTARELEPRERVAGERADHDDEQRVADGDLGRRLQRGRAARGCGTSRRSSTMSRGSASRRSSTSPPRRAPTAGRIDVMNRPRVGTSQSRPSTASTMCDRRLRDEAQDPRGGRCPLGAGIDDRAVAAAT